MKNSFPPIEKRSSSLASSDLSGEMTVDQFLSKYAQLTAGKTEEATATKSRNPSPLAAARTNSLRRTSIRRHISSSRNAAAPSANHLSVDDPRPYSRSEQALMRTECSSVLVDDLPTTAENDEDLSNGDSEHSPDERGGAKFQQSPSPDNRYGDKPPPPRRKSLLERWEEVQGLQRILPRRGSLEAPRLSLEGEPPSVGDSSSDSQFEDDAYPYRPRPSTRGSSQETGFEPTQLDEAALRPHSGVDALATPRRAAGHGPASSSGTEQSSRSDASDGAAAVPPAASLFDSGNVETIDDVIEAMLSAKPPPPAAPAHATKRRSADGVDWDQVDRASRPVVDKVRFPEPVSQAAQPPANEYEKYGGGRPRAATSVTQVMERLSQILSSQRVRSGAVQAAPHPSDSVLGKDAAIGSRPPTSRSRVAAATPRPIGSRLSYTSARSPPLPGLPTAAGRPLSPVVSQSPGSLAASPGRSPPATARRPTADSSSGSSSSGSGSSSSMEVIACDDETKSAQAAARSRAGPASFLAGTPVGTDAGSSASSSRTGSAGSGSAAGGRGSAELRVESALPRQETAVELSVALRSGSRERLSEDHGLVDPTPTQKLILRHIVKWAAVSTAVSTVVIGIFVLALTLL